MGKFCGPGGPAVRRGGRCSGSPAVGLSWVFRLYQSRVAAVRSVTVERQALIAIALAGLALGMQRITDGPTRPPMWVRRRRRRARRSSSSWPSAACSRRGSPSTGANGALSRPVVLVGRSHEVVHLSHLLENHPEIGYHPVGYLSDETRATSRSASATSAGSAPPSQALEQTGATGVLIAANGVPSVELNSLVRTLHGMGVHVHLSSGLTRIGHRRVRQLPMAHEPFFYLEPASPRRVALARQAGGRRRRRLAGARAGQPDPAGRRRWP